MREGRASGVLIAGAGVTVLGALLTLILPTVADALAEPSTQSAERVTVVVPTIQGPRSTPSAGGAATPTRRPTTPLPRSSTATASPPLALPQDLDPDDEPVQIEIVVRQIPAGDDRGGSGANWTAQITSVVTAIGALLVGFGAVATFRKPSQDRPRQGQQSVSAQPGAAENAPRVRPPTKPD